MISVNNAESLILSLVKVIGDYEEVDLINALGRILAIDLRSDLDFPRWHNAAMDGYALRYADLKNYPTLAIAPIDIPAGSSQPIAINPGECIRIFTGGILPAGTDTVVMQEDIEIVKDSALGDRLQIKIIPKLGEYVRHKGEFYRAGTLLLQAGIKINPPEIGILAAIQAHKVLVYRQPRVSIISTGNELKDLSDPLQTGQIIDSNQYTLSSLITQAGAIPIPLGIVGDRPEDLSKIIQTALTLSDLVISSGGVSVGDYDYVEQVLAELGADIHIRSCGIKPGKPLTIASFDQKLYFGVPGNPASAMVSFWRFIKGAIAKLSGANSQSWYPKYIQAITLEDLHAQGRRETYVWGYLDCPQASNQKNWQFQPISNQISGYSSGNLMSWAGVNGLGILKVNQTYIPKGEIVLVMVL